jgi:ribonuclease Z
MEAEAVMKKHSTVGEALFIGKRMDVQGAIVLTHFSQRYPRIPPMPSSSCSGDIPTIFAFDFMKLTPTNIQKASLLTSAVRLLYPEDGGVGADGTEDLDNIMEGSSSRDCHLTANDLLAIPGAFAAASTQKSVSQAPAQRAKP